MLKYKIILHDADTGPDETSITIAGFCDCGADLAAIACTAADLLLASAHTLESATPISEDLNGQPG